MILWALLILFALLICFYSDPPLRRNLREALKRYA